MAFRVGIYNIAGGKNRGDTEDVLRLDRIVSKIRRLHCDVIGLVEVRAGTTLHSDDASLRLMRAAREAGYYYCFGEALSEEVLVGSPDPVESSKGAFQGNMLLSRNPILLYHSFFMSDFVPPLSDHRPVCVTVEMDGVNLPEA